MFTRRGAAVLAGGILLGVGGVITGWDELLVLAAAALVAVVLAVVWVVVRPALEVERLVEPARVARGEPAMALLRVSNRGRFTSPTLIADDRVGERHLRVEIARLDAGTATTTTYRLPTDRRGVIRVGPLRLRREDPLGLAQRSQVHGEVATLWVHPATHALAGLPPGRRRTLDGAEADGQPHGTTTFHALREYEVGDDRRRIHWRTSARLGTLMVREYVDTTVPHLTVAVDVGGGRYADEDAFEAALEVAASLAVATLEHRYPLRLVTSAGDVVTSRGLTEDSAAVLDLLATVEPVGNDLMGLADALAASRGDALVLVSGTTTDDDLDPLLGVRRRYGSVHVLALTGGDPPAVPGATVTAAPDAVTLLTRSQCGNEPNRARSARRTGVGERWR